jgi:hypothetical protein
MESYARWLFVSDVMFSRFIGVLVCISILLLSMAEVEIASNCTAVMHLVYLSNGGWTFGLFPPFWLLGVMLPRASVYRLFFEYRFPFVQGASIPRSGITGSFGSSMIFELAYINQQFYA